MKFLLTRTSHYGDSNPLTPLEMERTGIRPVRERYDRLDMRTTDDPKKIPMHRGEDPSWWYDEGVDHTVVNGQIQRRFPSGARGWFIEVADLDELLKLSDLFGDLVIGRDFRNYTVRKIEIYDDYRE